MEKREAVEVDIMFNAVGHKYMYEVLGKNLANLLFGAA